MTKSTEDMPFTAFEESQQKYEKGVDDFLQKFYGQTYQGLFKNVDKVCGFKELGTIKMQEENVPISKLEDLPANQIEYIPEMEQE